MPQSRNAQTVLQLYAALRNKDTAAIEALMSPSITIYQSPQLPWGGKHEGPDEALQFFGKVHACLDSTVTLERILDAGNTIAVVGRTAGTVRMTDQDFDIPLVHLWHLDEEHRIERVEVYLDTEQMLERLHDETLSRVTAGAGETVLR